MKPPHVAPIQWQRLRTWNQLSQALEQIVVDRRLGCRTIYHQALARFDLGLYFSLVKN